MGSPVAKCECIHCKNHIEFPIESLGIEVACPHCQEITVLDIWDSHDKTPSSGAVSAVTLLSGFSGPLPRQRPSLVYNIGLLLVAVMMIVLPLIYVGLVGLLLWGIYWYATHCVGLLRRFSLATLFLYVAPLFMGAVMAVFMIKPLFARRAERNTPLAMNPGAEQTLFAFIARICELVGAPMPSRIDLDCQLNASAGFRRGIFSLFGNDLVLTIGLPLVAGLDLRQFAGVIAHEFGHFTQGFGMRLSYIIRNVNFWFARVIFERDEWDEALENAAAEASDGRIAILLAVTRVGVWFSRLVLRLLMVLGHGVSCFLLRQMEYDADGYQVKLVGSTVFESTVQRVRLLGAASSSAYKQMRTAWNLSKQLPDSVPSFVVHHETQLPAHVRDKIINTLGFAKTGTFDTHPCDADRIRCARQANEPGVFDMDLPATVLFSNFEVVAKQVTQLHYAEDIGIVLDPTMLKPTSTYVEKPATAEPVEPLAKPFKEGSLKLKISSRSE